MTRRQYTAAQKAVLYYRPEDAMPRGELPELIRGLLEPSAYPHPVDTVELVQTHVSFVFLAGDFVYKVKKPVDFGFLNFTTLARRRYYCQQEVLLNRRLCPDTYLGVVRIAGEGRRVRVEGRGKVLEYAVKMRRLPALRMMDRLLADGRILPTMVDTVARRLADFHAHSQTGPGIDRYGSLAVIDGNWQENFRQWESYLDDTVTTEQDRYLRAYVRNFAIRRRALLEQRVRQGRIRDCHGDIRLDAVCFTDGVCIFDCIEFNRRFRYSDVAADIAFLAMDLDCHGRPDLSERLVQTYSRAAGDPQVLELIDFYKCYRAAVRGKVEGFRLTQPEVRPTERREARQAARAYFRLACRYAATQPPPALIITCGLVATGKTAVARSLGEALDAPVISSDVVRKELAGLEPEERRFEPFERGIYSPAFTARTYGDMLERGRALLAQGRSVLLDATFGRLDQRQKARTLAEEMGARFVCVECRAEEAAIRRRLAERLRAGGDASDARPEIYEAQVQVFEPVTELLPHEQVSLDCDRPLGQCVLEARRLVGERLAPPA